MARYDGLIIPRSWNEYINKSDAATLAQALQQNNVLDNAPTENSTKGVRSGGVYDALATKQPTLTFDDVPTDGSDNPVKSNGIYDALATKQDTLTFDNAPTQDSDNPIKSGGVFTALGGKQDALTFDDVPTASSNNPVKSGGVYSALADGVIAGPVITVSIDISTSGINTKGFTAAPATYNNKQLIGYFGKSGTYRFTVMGVGNDTLYYYVSAPATTAEALLYPFYK